MWSWESTETPTAEPMTQWFGSGFGHRGSTSNCGASTPAAATAARFSRTTETTPSPVRRERKATTTTNLRFMISFTFRHCPSHVRGYSPRDRFSDFVLYYCSNLLLLFENVI